MNARNPHRRSLVDDIPIVESLMATILAVILVGLIGSVIPYAPIVVSNGYLANSVGTFLAWQCLTGPTCDYYSLMGGLLLGLYLTVVILCLVILGVTSMLKWTFANLGDDDDGYDAMDEDTPTPTETPTETPGP